MLDFKEFKIETNKNSSSIPVRFIFIDNEIDEESIEYIEEKIKEYEIYLEYDSKGEFNFEYNKKFSIEMIITFPTRKVPEDKKGLQNFVNRYVMDFSEYYHRINKLDNICDTNMSVET
ncbi:hypothetical protein [Methanobacterium sp. ACI-7]|uniref:hypothetical protein n=1 Tax=unclassified Methanobacterium TaxID=2627676 RepID=UPI0039C2E770